MKKRTTWILIADGSRARFFVNKGPGEGLEPALGTEFIADKRKSREIGSDRPGRTHDIGGPGRHSMEPPTDPHEYEKIEFARELAQKLEEETLAYGERVADNYLRDPFWVRMTKLSINHMQDAMGFTSEIEAAYNSYCTMIGLTAPNIPRPEQGGFARTQVAKQNLKASREWIATQR